MTSRLRLRRTPMPARSVPMARAAMPRRVAGLRAHRRRHMATNTPAVRDDLTLAQRARLYARAGGLCEARLARDCMVQLPVDFWHACHRQNRARAADNTSLANRWAGCPPCHRWQHNHPDAAVQSGHYVRTGLDPHRTPMCLPDGRIVRLSVDGQYEEVA